MSENILRDRPMRDRMSEGQLGSIAAPVLPETQVMGILNVTPDSFSDGGQWNDVSRAVARAHQMVEQGADIVDVGGESTRPGSQRLNPEEEQGRVLEILRQLTTEGVVVSLDTYHASTAQKAVELGVSYINDVSGGLGDPKMAQVIADSDVGYICQHWRGTPETMDSLAHYDDVVTEVLDELSQRLEVLHQAGVSQERIVIDPGLGFAKTVDQSWTLLANLERVVATGYPVLVGASRKRMLAAAAGPSGADPLARDWATVAVSTLAAKSGAWAVRVHEVAGSKAAVRVVNSWKEHG